MNNNTPSYTDIALFTSTDKEVEFQVVVDGEQDTVWATQQQMTELFGKARRTVGEHIKNLYAEGELDEAATRRDFRQVQKEGSREVTRTLTYYNLDVIISVGYRVKSQRGIEFRKWATKRLKEYLINGYSINTELLSKQKEKIAELESTIDNLYQEFHEGQKVLTQGLLSIITKYSKSFELLDRYDRDELLTEDLNRDLIYSINYDDVINAIAELKKELIARKEASELFGREKDDSLRGILGSISQTVFGELAYPSIEEQAAQLLYSIIKGHPFSDGNKRIGSFVFVWFLEQNNYHLTEANQEQKINENALVALALAVAQSLPEQRETIIKLIINLIKN
ncbi:virulence protein RhuM/Fic/DOC family protein [Rufibacter sp. LB8]|uniref:virulence protein RhuM/Fic/DOC family protein n=1 Tax=Rufibacter sp. LB8 TaxID=2777781 RepID=UPI001CEF918F|nr:virulence protein RhuM/Fic/DOC family protein [Rufibacter sp. LB8]